MAIIITNNLTLVGNATFGGTSGFTTTNYSQTFAGSVVTLKAGVTYTVTGQLTITGTAGSRCTLKSDTVISATGLVATGTPPNGTLTTTTPITVPTPPSTYSYIMSQAPTNTPLLKRGVTGMNGSNITTIASFPVVTPEALPDTGFTLSRSFSMSQRLIQIGLTTKFIHSGTTRTLNYVTTFDIDSAASSSTLLADNSYQNRPGVPNPNLWRSINWGELNPLPPLITVGYIE